MKHKQFQTFKTMDALSVIALLSTVLIVSGSIIYSNTGSNLEEFVVKDMQSLSEQILVGSLKDTTNDANNNDRAPASILDQLDFHAIGGNEGRIGHDPWGSAFHYKVLISDEIGYIVVISGGPDKTIQTDYTEIKVGPNGHLLGAKFASDDIGLTRKIK